MFSGQEKFRKFQTDYIEIRKKKFCLAIRRTYWLLMKTKLYFIFIKKKNKETTECLKMENKM